MTKGILRLAVQIMRGHKSTQFDENQQEVLLLHMHLVLNREDYGWLLGRLTLSEWMGVGRGKLGGTKGGEGMGTTIDM